VRLFLVMPVNRRYHLRKSAVKELADELTYKFGAPAKEILKGSIEIIELKDDAQVILSNGEAVLFRGERGLFPTLVSVNLFPLKHVVVDMGAVGPVTNGANIMGAGVVRVDEGISRGDLVAVLDEQHGKPLAIGTALADGGLLKGSKGEVVKNMHHIGDKLWDLTKGGPPRR
jgi:PUA-domain protein